MKEKENKETGIASSIVVITLSLILEDYQVWGTTTCKRGLYIGTRQLRLGLEIYLFITSNYFQLPGIFLEISS
jgi:hypothetical protein